MITDRDLVIKGIAEKKPNSSKVTDVMSEELITITAEASVEEASKLMAQHQIRRLPVVENQKLVGIVSLGDLSTFRYANERAGEALSDISEQTH
jgi:CBS domain-containing protein